MVVDIPPRKTLIKTNCWAMRLKYYGVKFVMVILLIFWAN